MTPRSLLPAAVLVCLAAVATAADPLNSLTGRVVDDTGTGVADAKVVLHGRTLNGWDTHHAASDSDGRFTVPAVRQGRFTIFARAPGRQVGLASIAMTKEAVADDVAITVVEPRTLRLHCVDAQGGPQQDAFAHTIELTGPNGDVVLRPLNVAAFGLEWPRSNAAGLLEVDGLPATGPMTVEIAHSEFVRSDSVEVPPDTNEPPTARLARGGSFIVSIRTDGVEVPRDGLRLDLFGEEPYFVDEPFPAPDRDGRYRFTAPFGTWSGLVRGDGVQTLPAAFRNIFVTEQDPAHVEIVLTPRGVVRGRVIEQATGQPVQGEIISAAVHSEEHDDDAYGWGAGWHLSSHAVTDEEGRFEITPGVGRVRLWPRSTDRGGSVMEPAKIEVVVPRDRPVDVEPFQRLPATRVTGIVLDPAGKPVPQAVIKPTGNQRHSIATIADRNGCFDLAVESIDRDDPESTFGSLSLRVFDPHRPLEAKVTVPVDLRKTGEAVTVRLKPSSIASPPGVVESAPRYGTVRPGEFAPELVGRQTLNADGPVRLADLRGKYVLLDFWTVWCGPCRRMKPEVEAAARLYADRLVVIGVHDNSVAPEVIAADVQENGPSFPTVIDTADDDTVRRYGVAAYPTYVLIGADGRVLLTSQHNDAVLLYDLLSTLRSFLHGPPRVEPPRFMPVEAVRP